MNWVKKAGRIPLNEIQSVACEVKEAIDYSDKADLIARYRGLGLQVDEDPASQNVVALVRQALRDFRPFSVIRIGDGEANLLSFGNNIETPFLDRLVAKMVINQQVDRFKVSTDSLYLVKHLMLESVCFADIVGVRGIYYMGMPDYKIKSPMEWAVRLKKKPRLIGVLRAESELLRMANLGYLKGKLIASANLYLAVINNLKFLFTQVPKSVILVTDQLESVRLLKTKFPDVHFDVISLPFAGANQLRLPRMPSFLASFEKVLRHDLAGSLVLVGAGPWAEFYCTVAKQRGAVAVDIGSGFDLLSGRNTRPFHRLLSGTSEDGFLFDAGSQL